jgi:hypothetical protein
MVIEKQTTNGGQMIETNAKTLENEIYDTYYDNGGEDARYDLWPAVIKAKGDIDKLNEILEEVQNGGF